MMPFPLSEAVAACSGAFFGDTALLSQDLQNITIDSRTGVSGALYVPVIGEVHDGHKFIDGAFQNGALCTLSMRPIEGHPYILVADTVEALQRIAEFYLKKFDVTVVGVTGSVGKTSTKEMLDTVLSVRYRCFKTPGNLNNQTGVPQAVFRIDRTHELAILELGTNHPGEIRNLARIIRPDFCVLTNIGVAHIEFFGSRKNIFLGKTEMLEYMKDSGTVIANGDDDLLSAIPGAFRYGFSCGCDVQAVDVTELGLSGTNFTVCCGAERMPMVLPVPGRHMVSNALAAIAVGVKLGIPLSELKKGVESFEGSAGRMEIQKTEKFTLLDDSYNANPSSVMAAIDVLEQTEGRHVCILGDMLELGAQSDEFHEVVGMYAARHNIDLILCVGPNSERTYDGAHTLKPGRAHYFETQEALLSVLPMILKKDDTVLVKASRGMHLEHTVAAIKGF